MLDSWLEASPRLRRAQSRAAENLYKAGVRADYATAAGGLLGILSGLAFAWGYNAAGLTALWLSALLDAVDGAIARDFEGSTAFGGCWI
jgi:phosphatidylglycerophosphate synthase